MRILRLEDELYVGSLVVYYAYFLGKRVVCMVDYVTQNFITIRSIEFTSDFAINNMIVVQKSEVRKLC